MEQGFFFPHGLLKKRKLETNRPQKTKTILIFFIAL